MKLHGLAEALQAQERQQDCQEDLDEKCGEGLKNDRANLGACYRRWHHYRYQAVVDKNHTFLLRVHRLEVVDEAHSGAYQNAHA